MDHEGMLIPLRDSLEGTLSGFDLSKLTLVATHTHTAPYLNETIRHYYPTQEPIKYNPYYDFVKEKLKLVIQQAWNNRAYGGLSFEKGEAAVGFCRIVKYTDGTHVVYGDTTRPDFAGMLTPFDHTLELMYTSDMNGILTGIMINIVSPSQVSEGAEYLSADFWHDVRLKLKQTYGDNIFILPYGGAAGDMSSRNLEGTSPTRNEIGEMIADSVRERYPFAMNTIKYKVEMGHVVRDVYLTTKSYYQNNHPVYSQPRPTYLAEIHAVRLDNTAWVNNPFELFNAWGKAIQNESVATQTIIAQMSGLNRGGYLPTEEALHEGVYSEQTTDGWCDNIGGQQLVDNSVEMINSLFVDDTAPVASNDSANTDENVPVTVNVLDNDTDPNGDTLYVISVTQPFNGFSVIATIDENDAVTYIPSSGFKGSDSFTYTISDGSETDTATVSIYVGSSDADLILHWQFEENSGTIAADSSGNNLDGTLYNGPVWDNDAAVGTRALAFDGVNDYVSVDSPALDFGSNDFTVAIWVKKLESSGGGWDNVWGVNKWDVGTTSNRNEWSLALTNGGNDFPVFAIASGTTTYKIIGTQNLIIGQWHHLAGVRSGDEIRLYVDGQLESTQFVGTVSINNAGRNLRIADSEINGFQTHGIFDDLRIYSRALAESEIQD
ncbi:MAG: Ig-like domain-containing protein, partial [Sulfurovum sp.]|nr:Ig-like domain-containing protein [Sulfurovum sp.]